MTRTPANMVKAKATRPVAARAFTEPAAAKRK